MNRVFRTTALITAACLLVASSCSRDIKNVRAMLATAEALMETDPQASLYTLSAIDSSTILSMSERDKANLILLGTQARHRCGISIKEDTAIYQATEFFKRKGPDASYGKALGIRGTVHFENGDQVSALEDYKDMEKFLADNNGSPLAFGLINTRIAELYKLTYVNDSITVARYRKALEYFLKAGVPEMVMQGRLSLARVLLKDSPEEAVQHIREGAKLAEHLSDSSMLLVAKELETAYHLAIKDYERAIRTANDVIARFRPADKITLESITNVMLSASTAYARTGMPDSARRTASLIPEGILNPATMHFLYYDIAISEGNLQKALEHLVKGEQIADSTMTAGYGLHLRGVEKHYENSRIKEHYITVQHRFFLAFTILIGILSVIIITCLFIYSRNLHLKQEIEKSTDIIRRLNEEREIMKSDERIMRNNESRLISEEMLKVSDELMDAYYKYGRTKAIAEHVKTILEKSFPVEGTMNKVRRIVDASYPGFLSGLAESYPALKEKDIYLIALMACGFSTGTICALRRISESSLYVEKTRIARKIGDGIRLSEFISKSLQKTKVS